MKLLSTIVLTACALVFLVSSSYSRAAQASVREVAITIDDLPASAAETVSASTITEMTTKLLTTLRDQKVPAVGFVTEKKLFRFGEVDQRIKALQKWVDSGFELEIHLLSCRGRRTPFTS